MDELSGMTVNLVEVDHWLRELQDDWHHRVLNLKTHRHLAAELLYDIRDFLVARASPAGVDVESLHLSEERSGVFSWDRQMREGFFRQECSYFLEFFESGRFVDLMLLRFIWLSPENCQEDLFTEGLKLLKDVKAVSQSDLAETLTPFKGILQENGNILQSIILDFKSLGYRIEL